MKMTRTVKMNGTTLNVSGNYKKIVDPEGPIAEQETFDIESIIDNELDVTDLFTDYYDMIEKEVINVISLEDPADYPQDDDEIIEQETLDALKDMFKNNPNVNYEMNNVDQNSLKAIDSIPVYFEDELELVEMLDAKIMIDNLKEMFSNENDPIIAAKVSDKGIRLITISDLKQIK